MKLAVPSFAMWLAGFYMIFHCLLNVVAELLRFSDRKFFEGERLRAAIPHVVSHVASLLSQIGGMPRRLMHSGGSGCVFMRRRCCVCDLDVYKLLGVRRTSQCMSGACGTCLLKASTTTGYVCDSGVGLLLDGRVRSPHVLNLGDTTG